uniref:Uncharacterized protein n=1 Tax=Helicotheca tamesis TaxID=374047 RepID=A0A7S2MXG2_9STRA|mmetsp:Transcript_5281/g.7234  ORF Transcript_5281/g.7234 Transcript_5281/m.7234 type:complete len:313 (+) Transcript_5281:155-1093(+)|eukprot:CAMPEP_0185723176 /NCGR_PEP_ID=MMETSP1171-20130828/105_1 /TAXON_ID=374046 /ORGANISM="Helicotheca tamensis, Strain CCMP826" /LENGTH=312 /DNA_ID=CAMNT_0028390843 /DNA_START=88 /DNA_END=1029 /DNA_ORIENTATION=+
MAPTTTTPSTFFDDVSLWLTEIKSNAKILQNLMLKEAVSSVVWSICSCLLRISLGLLVLLAGHRTTVHGGVVEGKEVMDEEEIMHEGGGILGWMKEEVFMIMSVLAGWALCLFPRKVAAGTAPGFVFASTWLLLPMQNTLGTIPNIPTRICEMGLGRLSLQELAVVLPIHFLGAMIGVLITKLLTPGILASHLVEPIIYSEGNPWLVDLMRETIVNAAFTVAILVLPEIMKLNKVPQGLTLLFMWPLYNYSVDAAGTASAFGPDVIYALRCIGSHEEVPLGQSSHMIGPILGGLLGGRIMRLFFPDDHTHTA